MKKAGFSMLNSTGRTCIEHISNIVVKSTDAPARCRALIAALRRTANAELAFVQLGVNRSWAYWWRKRDPEFTRDWAAAAVAAGRARLGLKTPARPSWDGVPLILAGNLNSRERRLRRANAADFTMRASGCS